jgi:hypothetical protein
MSRVDCAMLLVNCDDHSDDLCVLVVCDGGV